MWNRFTFNRKINFKEQCIRQIDTGPIRDELFSGDRLAQHAKEAACSYCIETCKVQDRLLPRLADNEKVLLKTHELLHAAFKAKRRIAPAGEWLLDNFYLVEAQIRIARRHLPEEYSKELPHLANGPLEGFPPFYHLAFFSHRLLYLTFLAWSHPFARCAWHTRHAIAQLIGSFF